MTVASFPPVPILLFQYNISNFSTYHIIQLLYLVSLIDFMYF